MGVKVLKVTMTSTTGVWRPENHGFVANAFKTEGHGILWNDLTDFQGIEKY